MIDIYTRLALLRKFYAHMQQGGTLENYEDQSVGEALPSSFIKVTQHTLARYIEKLEAESCR